MTRTLSRHFDRWLHDGRLFAVLAAWLLLGESMSLLQVAGLALLMFGVMHLKAKPGAPATPAAQR